MPSGTTHQDPKDKDPTPRHWVVAFLAGWAILRVVALVPVLGGLVWFAAAVGGPGALAVASWHARSATPAPV